MTNRRRALFALLIAATTALGGLALAQEYVEGTVVDESVEGNDDGSVTVRQTIHATVGQQRIEITRIQRFGSNASRQIANMLDEGRRENDIIRVTCLNDKLTQTNANLRTLDSRIEAWQEAVDRGDDDQRNHQFTVITVLGQQFVVLQQDANLCVGQGIFETGATRVTLSVEEWVPGNDPFEINPAGGVEVFSPTIIEPRSGDL